MNGPLPEKYGNNPDVVMMTTQLAHRPRKRFDWETGKYVQFSPPITVCGKRGGEVVPYEEFREARNSWMVCNPCWAPERIKRRRF